MTRQAVATTLSQLGEFGLIEHLTARFSSNLPKGVFGVGDDCAVLPLEGNGRSLLVTTDALVENRHFSLEHSSFHEVGWKSLAVSVSDIAAMGGDPKYAVVSLELRDDIPVPQLEELYRGASELAEQYGVAVVGGDTVSGGEFSITWTVLGFVDRKPIFRHGASPGDELWVSGSIGGAGAGLAILDKRLECAQLSDQGESCFRRHRSPVPRVSLGKVLLEQGIASAMIDVSDGLLQDAAHIARRSEVQIIIDPLLVPFEKGLETTAFSRIDALTSGDDYELLFTVSPRNSELLRTLSDEASLSVELKRIGNVQEVPSNSKAELLLRDQGELVSVDAFFKSSGREKKMGYQHF